MTNRLTHVQKQVLYWITDQVRLGYLENPFMVVWVGGHPVGNIPIPGRPTLVYPDGFTEDTLSALVAAGRLDEKRVPLRTYYTLYPGTLTGIEDAPAGIAPQVNPVVESILFEPAPQSADRDTGDHATSDHDTRDRDHDHRVRLAKFIDAYFDREELQMLAFELGVDFDNLAGEKKDTKARNLVIYMHTRDRLPELERKLAAERPSLYSRLASGE